MSTDEVVKELKMDPAALYREEVFTDRRAGTLRRLTPVRGDGAEDGSRSVVYIGQAQLLTPVGPLPLSFEIEAASLEEAARNFGDAAKTAVEEAIEELKEMRREAASSIITPDMAGGMGGGIVGPGGMGGTPPGGGLIRP